MKTNPFYKIKESIDNKIFKRIDRKILVYLVFVGVSTIFWFLNELNNNFNTTVDYPIRFTHLPKNKILTNELPRNLQLNRKAAGLNLYLKIV